MRADLALRGHLTVQRLASALDGVGEIAHEPLDHCLHVGREGGDQAGEARADALPGIWINAGGSRREPGARAEYGLQGRPDRSFVVAPAPAGSGIPTMGICSPSSPMPRDLTFDQLDAMLDSLQLAGAPLPGNLAPGLSDGEIDRLVKPLGLRLPSDVRTWFRWRNGATSLGHAGSSIGPWRLSSLSEAVQQTQLMRELGLEIEDEVPAWWPGSWFALSDNEGKACLAVECEPPGDGAVELFDTTDCPRDPPIRLPSLAAVVDGWIAAIRAGVYSAETGWLAAPQRAPSRVDTRFL